MTLQDYIIKLHQEEQEENLKLRTTNAELRERLCEVERILREICYESKILDSPLTGRRYISMKDIWDFEHPELFDWLVGECYVKEKEEC